MVDCFINPNPQKKGEGRRREHEKEQERDVSSIIEQKKERAALSSQNLSCGSTFYVLLK